MSALRGLVIADAARKRVRVVAAAVVVVVIAIAGVVVWHRTRALPSGAAFKYGDTVVSTQALERRIHVLGALYGVKQPTASSKVATFRRAAAQADAMTLILDKAASSAGIVISDKSARDTLTKMLSSQLSGNSQQAFDALLTKFGVSEGDVLQEIKRQQAIGLLFRKVTKQASDTPSAADVTAYFQKHASDFAVPARRHLLNIVVKKRGTAQSVVAAARRGDDFAALARRYSLDDSTRSKGGDLGTVAASQLASGYAKVAFGVRTGSVFGPVHTSYGWNVGKVVATSPGRRVTLAKVRTQVVANMRSERALDAWRSWLGDQVAQAHITYAADYRPADPDALPAMAGLPSTSAVAP